MYAHEFSPWLGKARWSTGVVVDDVDTPPLLRRPPLTFRKGPTATPLYAGKVSASLVF
jgi:hypothetical protein